MNKQKIEPCPFPSCGNHCVAKETDTTGIYWVTCTTCSYSSRGYISNTRAIKAHNDLVNAKLERNELREKLPKIWRLDEQGKLVQDVPLVPMMKVWVCYEDEICEVVTHAISTYGCPIIHYVEGNGTISYPKGFDSCEAAEASISMEEEDY